MTLIDAAKKLGVGRESLYNHIQRKSEIGLKFYIDSDNRWCINDDDFKFHDMQKELTGFICSRKVKK